MISASLSYMHDAHLISDPTWGGDGRVTSVNVRTSTEVIPSSLHKPTNIVCTKGTKRHVKHSHLKCNMASAPS